MLCLGLLTMMNVAHRWLYFVLNCEINPYIYENIPKICSSRVLNPFLSDAH